MMILVHMYVHASTYGVAWHGWRMHANAISARLCQQIGGPGVGTYGVQVVVRVPVGRVGGSARPYLDRDY